MLERISSGWNFQRVLYVIVGVYVVVQSALNKEWLGVMLGSYFAAMGLFALGCAGGACYGNFTPPKSKPDVTEVNYEEVKQK